MWFKNENEMPETIVISSRGNSRVYNKFGLWNLSDTEFAAFDDPVLMPPSNKQCYKQHYKDADIDTLRNELEKHFQELLNK